MTIIVRDDFTGSGDLNPAKWADASTTFYRGSTAPHYMQQVGGFATAPFGVGSIPWRVSTFNATVTDPGTNRISATYDAITGIITAGKYHGFPPFYAQQQYKIDGTLVGSLTDTQLQTLPPGDPSINLNQVVSNLNIAYGWHGANNSAWYQGSVKFLTINQNPIAPAGQGIDDVAINSIYQNNHIFGIGSDASAGVGNSVFITRWVAPGGMPTATLDLSTFIIRGNIANWFCHGSDDGFIWVRNAGAAGSDIALLKFDETLTLIHTILFSDLPAPLAANWGSVYGIVGYHGMLAFDSTSATVTRVVAAYTVNLDYSMTFVGETLVQQTQLIRLHNGLVLGNDGVISLDPPITSGKGEAVTVPAPGAANQYIEAGMPVTLGSTLAPSGAMLIGLRLTGGSGAIEGITAQYAPNSDGTTTNFKLSQTHSGVQTYFGPGAGGVNVATPAGYTARIEAIDTSAALKVNGVTIIAGVTAVLQEGEGYFAIENDTIDAVNGSNDRIDYIEYGVFGSDVITVANNVGISGGGSPPASAIDVTNIVTTPPPDAGRMFFALDTNGSGDGQNLQRVDNVTMTVGSRLPISTGVGVIGGVMDASRILYIPVTGSPAKVWKVDGNSFTEIGLQTLGPPAINPYPVLDLAGNAYFVTYAAGNTLVFKVRCSDLTILNTLTINGFSSANIKGWDGVAIDNARGYLYIAAQAGGVLEILRVALGSFTGGPWLGGFSTLTVCNAAFVFGSYLYLCGGSGDIVGSPAGANWQIYRFNIDVPSSTTLTGLASNVITCYTLDAPHGKAYFGNYENTPGHGRIARVDLATFTIDMTVDFGANSGPVRALAVDDTDTNIYATMAPAAHGGATWWLMKTDLNLASPTFITDATWTGTPPVQGAKLIVFIGPGNTPPPPPPPPAPSSRVNISNGDTTNINASEALRAPWVNNDGDWIDANAVPQGPTPYASQSFTPGNPGVATLNISAIDGDVTIRGPTYVTQVLIDGVPADAFWCDNSNHSTPLPSTSFRTVWARNPNHGTTMQVTFADTDGSVRAFKVLGPLINDYTTYVGVSNTPNVWEVDLTSDAVVIAAAASPGRIDYPIGYDVSYGTDPNGLHYQRSAVTIAGGGLRDLSWRLKYGMNLTEVYSRFVVYIENDVADGMVENGIKLLAGASNETIPSIGFYPLIVSRFEMGPKSMPNNRGLYKALEYLYDAESGSGFPPLVSMGDAILRAGHWYNIEKRVKLNTGAGIHDGICQCWINGHLVFTDTTRLYRNDNTTPLTEFFVNIYHGGTTPVIADIHFRVAKLAISTSYIGIAPEFQSNYPLWRRNMPTVNQAYSFAGTANMNGVSINTGGEAGEPINTWNGLSASDDALFSTACGGHGVVGQQLWRNAVYKFDLSPDVPAWTREHDGSTTGTIDPANPANWGVPYYTDLLPGARHSYSSSQFIKARNRAMLFAGAAYWQDGNSLSGAVSGFNPTTKLWDAAGTWASCPIAHIAMAVAKHPVTEDVYVDKVGLIYKWGQVANSWSQFVPAGGADPWSGDFCPLLIDVNGVRNRLMSFGPHGGDPTGIFLFDLTSRVLTVVHMTGALGGFEPYSTMVHDLDNDRYLTVQGTGLFAIDPNTWVATIVCTVPRPAPGTDEYGTQNKLAYFQKYGGVAYVSEFAVNVTFVPTR